MSALVVAGCGLLGTSVALAYRRVSPEANIVGIEPDSAAREVAASLGVYSHLCASAQAAVSEIKADGAIGIAASPPAQLAVCMSELAEFCSLVMDVGSIKAPVVDALQAAAASASEQKVPSSIVPCHPMAGSHQQGPAAGHAELFDGRWVFVVPMASSDPAAVLAAHEFWQLLGAQTEQTEPLAHDQAVAYTSHLPHLLASAYMGVATSLSESAPSPSPSPAAAGTGFMEFTRLAKANPEMWSQVLSANQAGWRPLLGRYIESLQALDEFIAAAEPAELEEWLEARKAERVAVELPSHLAPPSDKLTP